MGEETVAQLEARYQVRPSQIQASKKAISSGAAGVFSNGQEQRASSDAALVSRFTKRADLPVYQEIGLLKVERESGISWRRGPVHNLAQRRKLVDRHHSSLSMTRQCALLGVSRSGLYYRTRGTSEEDLVLIQVMDRQYLETPSTGRAA